MACLSDLSSLSGPKTLCNACGVRYKKGLPLKIGLVDEQ